MKDWKQVKDEIEQDLDRIFWKEPPEVEMSRRGIFPSGASVHGQVLGNLLFLVGDTSAMGWKCAQPTINAALKDPAFTVDHVKALYRYSTMSIAQLVGEEGEGCPAPWLNLPKVYAFAKDIEACLPSVKSKEELEDLLWSWFNYVNTLNRWLTVAFPWEMAGMLPLRTREELEHMQRLHDEGLRG
jgi:hypothetical protein